MRTAELESVLRDKLRSAGLVADLDEEKSQFLDMWDGFFAEIVLNDGSKLTAAEQIIRSVKEELKERGVEVDAVVRAVWKVKEIRFIGSARGVSGGLRAALEFEGVLESGSRTCGVSVEVTLAALNRLREKFAMPAKVGSPGWAREGDVDEGTLIKVVGEFLALQLSSGGTSYWDPIRFPKLEMNEAAVSYLLPDSKAFKQLRAAIDRFLGEYALENSLEEVASRKGSICRFEHVLPDLSNHMGGAFRTGDQVSTSAWTLFQELGELERKRLELYYLKKVEGIPESFKRKYPRIFVN